MNNLFSSHRYRVTALLHRGKKNKAGEILVLGLPSGRGDHREVLALDDGIVTESEYCYNLRSRKRALNNHIIIKNVDGISTVYSNLGRRLVKVGDYVKRGDAIAIMGDERRELRLGTTRNDRYVDICDVYGFEREAREYNDGDKLAYSRQYLADVCGLDEFELEVLSDRTVEKLVRAIESAARRSEVNG